MMAAIEVVYEVSGSKKFSGRATRDVQAGFELIKDRLIRLGIAGRWVVRPADQGQMRTEQRFKAMGPMENPMRVRVRCRPGDNSSCWEFDIRPPVLHDNTHPGLQKLVDRLNQQENALDDESPEETEPVEDEKLSEEERPEDLDEPTNIASSNGSVITETPQPFDASALAATLSRLSQVVQRGQTRQEQSKLLQSRLQELINKRGEISATIDKVEKELAKLRDADAADSSLLEAAQLLALAKDIKLT